MLEVAIISLKCAMRDEVPEFMDFFNERSWEKRDDEGSVESAEATAPDGASEVTESSDISVTEAPVCSDEISESTAEQQSPAQPTEKTDE